MFRFFFSFVLFSRDNPRVDVKVAVFDDEASGPLHPKVAVYFAVATGLPFTSASSFLRSSLVFAFYKKGFTVSL